MLVEVTDELHPVLVGVHRVILPVDEERDLRGSKEVRRDLQSIPRRGLKEARFSDLPCVLSLCFS